MWPATDSPLRSGFPWSSIATWPRNSASARKPYDTLYDAFGQRQVSTIFTQLNLYRVILEVAPSFQQDPVALRSIYVRSATGDPISLATIAHYEQSSHTPTIAHQGQFPAATLSFNLAPGEALGDAVSAIDTDRKSTR